jgi:hypothetical protein
MNVQRRLLVLLIVLGTVSPLSLLAGENRPWSEASPEDWPQITLVNQITYTDEHHPIAGCSFLIQFEDEVLAATAKHILVYFKSEAMDGVDFQGTLKAWKAFPKDNPGDLVVFDRLINVDPEETIERIPADRDWLLFTVSERAENIQPLVLRNTPLEEGERVYIVGWRYSDKDCPQVIYPGNFVRVDGATVLISTADLSDNTMPGLSGSPVIDAAGRVIGLMSQKAGKLERVSGLGYPRQVLRQRVPDADAAP